MLFATAESVWSAVITVTGLIVVAWMNQRAAEKAARKVEDVKKTLEKTTASANKKLDAISKTGEAVHVLVNSSMSAQLKISMIALRRVAELTSNHDDVAAAELAEKLFREHEVKQNVLDTAT